MSIHVSIGAERVDYEWSGNTNDIVAETFLEPIFEEALELGRDGSRLIAMRVHELEFINSSTISQFVKFLKNTGASGTHRVQIHYDGEVKWQRLNFTMFDVLKTPDNRIVIEPG